jgi:Outer membrane lipoprotein carrier protein LolA-like
MISGHRRRALSALGAIAAIAAGEVFGGAALAQALDANELLAALARVARSTATFEETRTIAALTVPIVRRGTLRYVRPDQLEMVVTAPAAERIEISGDNVIMESRSGTRRVRLTQFPAAAIWVESVRATLAGDQQALNRYFRVRATGRMAAWTLELTPFDNELADVVNRIVITGVQDLVNRIEIEERSGDRSVMVITANDRR